MGKHRSTSRRRHDNSDSDSDSGDERRRQHHRSKSRSRKEGSEDESERRERKERRRREKEERKRREQGQQQPQQQYGQYGHGHGQQQYPQYQNPQQHGYPAPPPQQQWGGYSPPNQHHQQQQYQPPPPPPPQQHQQQQYAGQQQYPGYNPNAGYDLTRQQSYGSAQYQPYSPAGAQPPYPSQLPSSPHGYPAPPQSPAHGYYQPPAGQQQPQQYQHQQQQHQQQYGPPASGYSGYQSPPPPQTPQQSTAPQYGYQSPPPPQTPISPQQDQKHYGATGYVPPPSYATAGATSTGYHPQHHAAAQATTPSGEKITFQGATAPSKPLASGGVLETFASGLNSALHSYARNLFPATSSYTHTPTGAPGTTADAGPITGHRFDSFAPVRGGNRVKWYVDGKDYMYAVSVAIENAKKSIYILDWWLSPEVYMRRPPKLNERYRLDRLLQAAAARGVRINIIVYKEVTQALTLSSAHTKHHLEDLHQNICVFRHPDHLPDRDNVIRDTFNKMKSGTYRFGDGLKGLYGLKDDVTLYFAHHEKLCLIDSEIAFMGGLDLCFGRYDTNDHPIADAHPHDLNAIIFPGQDYNNARFMDFHNVPKFEENLVSRTELSRMGWTDVEIALTGPTVHDLERHFIERWNFIYEFKYDARKQRRYAPMDSSHLEGGHGFHRRQLKGHLKEKVKHAVHHGEEHYAGYESEDYGTQPEEPQGVRLQIARSCSKWSHGVSGTEHSIANAYIEIISAAKHFVYMENQFFITATDPKQRPILNMIGRAIVDRIIRAHQNREQFRIIVIIPAVPGFAGDLQADAALGTRAIMEFQYRSIHNDRGFSIMEQLRKAGIDPTHYIRFFNLRNYDRINTASIPATQSASGVSYDSAARAHDDQVGSTYGYPPGARGDEYARYQQHTQPAKQGEWDSVSRCYMLGGPDIRSIPWHGPPEAELDAFVSEELYVHSKLLIADDRIVICGSANLNDRSQLGDHDSEIACIIEDPTPLPSYMAGKPFTASHFAGTLRRHIFRKHLGLIPAQGFDTVDANMLPIPEPNIYDFDSPEDRLVQDPLSDEFWNYWTTIARVNTQAFERVFHAVPTDLVRNWKQYDEYWSKHFAVPKPDKNSKTSLPKNEKEEKEEKEPPVKWGHVVKSEFSEGERGVREVKEILASVRGTLVEMPLGFLVEEDIAKEGLGLNAITETLYT
ncbi:phospholipase D/nuclease [Ascodesmis nigricans]|uniref:phospholipase D n=1 Tax=Ascodesmis nigricans TaxID=341454 RepID=A0A4S2MKR0_9PEZI|nr:phospholipase D/nuclease [Ascodesmis nigricans]